MPPPNADGTLRMDSAIVDDGITEATMGNRDRIAHCGERIQLEINVRNQNNSIIQTGVSGTLTTDDELATVFDNAPQDYPDIYPGAVERNIGGYMIDIDIDTPERHQITFQHTISTDSVEQGDVTFTLEIVCSTKSIYVPFVATP